MLVPGIRFETVFPRASIYTVRPSRKMVLTANQPYNEESAIMNKVQKKKKVQPVSLNASSIILGFSGSIGSGCSYISSMIPEISNNNYEYFKLSNILREELKKEGIEDPNIQQLQDKGNLLRKTYGNNYLVILLLEKLRKGEVNLTAENIIIDGIKNDGEVELLRSFANFYLFSINAKREIRCKRVLNSGIFASESEFIDADKRDEHENEKNGQQVKKCNYLSDIIIVNGKTIPKAAAIQRGEYVRKIYQTYITLIEDSVSGKYSPEIFPSLNELCMTLAYALSKKSSCLKRKVGSVIVDLVGNETKSDERSEILAYPYIISSGYNEVPMGSKKCIFHEKFQKCFRDFLQEEHAEKIKFCPSCGEKVDVTTTCSSCGKKYNGYIKFCPECKKEIKESHRCAKCDIKIFEEHLPGSKHTPGKLLDMCRALHAEEMAILGLAKRGGNSGGNLVLFATTQPCNLCANKIVSAGIKKVVFAEPYLMEEAAETLEKGGVTLETFEGVKSSAYFKLYQ
jgi:deoxycytidylate deaminase